jgi:hypothetical protein
MGSCSFWQKLFWLLCRVKQRQRVVSLMLLLRGYATAASKPRDGDGCRTFQYALRVQHHARCCGGPVTAEAVTLDCPARIGFLAEDYTL